jgi:phosphonate transport system substrate-binding protein
MRDTDRDLTSVFVVRSDSPAEKVADLKGKTVGVGAVDSPQATLIPCSYLRQAGLVVGTDVTVRRFDVGVGLHGDHIGGERDAVRALLAGQVDAAAVIDSNHLLFGREGTTPTGSTKLLAQTGRFDHCNMTVVDTAPSDLVKRFGDLLLSMSYADPEARPLLDLEGLTRWQEGRTSGYGLLAAAVGEEVTAAEYQP